MAPLAILLIVGFFSWMAIDIQQATKIARKREELEERDITETFWDN